MSQRLGEKYYLSIAMILFFGFRQCLDVKKQVVRGKRVFNEETIHMYVDEVETKFDKAIRSLLAYKLRV